MGAKRVLQIAAVLGRDFKRGNDDLTVLAVRRGVQR